MALSHRAATRVERRHGEGRKNGGRNIFLPPIFLPVTGRGSTAATTVTVQLRRFAAGPSKIATSHQLSHSLEPVMRPILVLAALLVLFTSCLRPSAAADLDPNELELTTERVIIFKDGYCL